MLEKFGTNVLNLKKKTDKTHLIQFQLFILYKPTCLQKIFMDDYYPSGYFPQTDTMG